MSRATQNDKHADKLVFETAVKMADAVFDEAMSKDNALWRGIRAKHPSKSIDALRRIFSRALAPELLGDARATLAQMLSSNISPALKEEIYDALLRDKALRRGRNDKRILTHH